MAQISLSTVPGKIVAVDTNDNTVKFPVDLFPARQVKLKVTVGSIKFSLGQDVSDTDSLSYAAGEEVILTVTNGEDYLHFKSAAISDEFEVEV